jgi:hypothetical protein
MGWDALFSLTTVIALAGWISLIILPRRPLVLSLVLYAAVGLLCLIYTAIFVAIFSGLADPARLAGFAAPDLSDYSIPGLRALFMSDAGIVIGWTHYLAFDLFIGTWIARDADSRGVGRIVQVPFLFVTLMAGPIGLLAWLMIRGWTGRRGEVAA